jgi:hypothetical protein
VLVELWVENIDVARIEDIGRDLMAVAVKQSAYEIEPHIVLGRHGTATHFGFYTTGCRFSFEPISIIEMPFPKFVIIRRFFECKQSSFSIAAARTAIWLIPSEKAGSSDRLHASRYCLSDEEGDQSTLYDVPAESEICRDRFGKMGEALRHSIFTKWRETPFVHCRMLVAAATSRPA